MTAAAVFARSAATMGETVRIAILGASGYTGADLVRLALGHPRLEIVALAANARAGQHMGEIWPHFAAHPGLPQLEKADAIDFDAADIVFGCLPHAAGAELLASLDRHPVIDLSADFRLADASAFADWYGVPHPAPQLLADAVYGLT
ncbi:MAG: N-acetyl-gamma-glutamyl-phosphate reductase, partial [Thermaurantiacus sp.]